MEEDECCADANGGPSILLPPAPAQVICEASDLCKMIREELRLVFREFQLHANFRSESDAEVRSPKPPQTDLIVFSQEVKEQRARSHELPHVCGASSLPSMKNPGMPRRQAPIADLKPPLPTECLVIAVPQSKPAFLDSEEDVTVTPPPSLPGTVAADETVEESNQGMQSVTSEVWKRGNTTDSHAAGAASTTGTSSKAVGKARNKRGQIALMDFDFAGTATLLQRLTLSRGYETFSGTLIIANAFFIGWQAQHMAEWYRDEAEILRGRGETEHFALPPVVFLVGNVIFAILFTVELLLRWMADGLVDFFKTNEMNWNVLDVMIVFVGIVEAVLDIVERATNERSGGVLQNISTMRMLRILRVVRVVRVIRVMKFFRELRMMVYSIIGSMKNLLWVMVILGVTFYLFGITFTSAVTNELVRPEDYWATKNEDLTKYFGTVDKAILALFMSMSGGNDWIVYYNALALLPYHYRYFFLLFIIFTLFAIVNIVTGVFVEAALQSNYKDRDIIAHEELVSKKRYLESMQDIFEEMDTDEQGTINMEEFEGKLQDERVIAYFNALKLDVSDARILFQLLDTDESGEITIDEFIVGCYKLQGESRSLDLKFMQFEVKALSDISKELHGMVMELSKFLIPEARRLAPRGTTVPKSSQNPENTEEASKAPSNWKHLFGIDKATLKSETSREMRKSRVNIRPTTMPQPKASRMSQRAAMLAGEE